MPELLIELFSEEIPARMQGQAARDFERLAGEHLKKAGLSFERLQAFAGPRRLTLIAEGVPGATPDRREEIKGPKVSAPPQALEGFLRKTGLSRENLIERDGVFFAEIAEKGRSAPEIVAEMLEAVLRGFPWPKAMRWGSGSFRWVRPLKRILCLFDGQVVPFEIEGIKAGDLTEGHRFMGTGHAAFSVRDSQDYRVQLLQHFVLLDPQDRRRVILDGARAVCAAKGLELVEDEGLLDEVAGLAEWPVPILGDMDPAFLDLPPEVIRTSMRTHQKYFAVRKPGEAGLAPHFVVVANIAAADGGAVIAAGNAKVLSARLNDARFFWTEDQKTPLEARLETLKGVTFHAKLGTMYERVERIEALAREIAPLIKDKNGVGADPDLAAKAARLAKADLATGMVGEFPELQGIMGGYYARLEGRGASFDTAPSPPAQDDEPERPPVTARQAEQPSPEGVSKPAWWEGLSKAEVHQVADAVRDHYKPIGPSDTIPTAPVTVAVALADKLDTLVGFFAIDEKPTGSRDPYALRRAELGMLRIISVNQLRLSQAWLARKAAIERAIAMNLREHTLMPDGSVKVENEGIVATADIVLARGLKNLDAAEEKLRELKINVDQSKLPDLLAFFADRLKVLLRDEGKRHDLLDAVFALGDDDLVRIVARVEALSGFLATEDGATLLAGYKRAVNILKAEEKKTPLSLDGRGVGGEGDGRDGSGKGAGGGASSEISGTLGASTPIPGPSPLEGEGSLNPLLSDHAPPEEAALAAALRVETERVDEALAREDFTAAMRHLAHLRAPVDAFLDGVLVNDPDPEVRLNRLRLLTQVRDTANRVADFSLISG